MNQAVSIGDDGNPPGADDGPLLAALKTWFADMRAQAEHDREQRRAELLQARMAAKPAYAPVSASGTIDANGNLVLDLGGPQIGRRWSVRVLSFSDAGSFFNTMGSASVALACGQRTGSTITPNMVRWPFTTVPNSATFGADEQWFAPRDHVLLAITGGTTGQIIQATAWIQDFDPIHAITTAEV